MPAPSSMTLEATVTEVLARIGQLDDGVSNPLLVAEAKAHINAAQRQLAIEYGWLAQRRRSLVSVAAGRRWVDLPADAMAGQIASLTWEDAGVRTLLTCGIAPAERNVDADEPQFYDLAPTPGVASVAVTNGGTGYANGLCTVSGGTRLTGGHDPVVRVTTAAGIVTLATVEDSGSEWSVAPTLTPPGGGSSAVLTPTLRGLSMIELCPIPADAGTLEVEYTAGVVALTEDTDELALDAEAVIGRAAMLLATVKGLPGTNGIAQVHALYMSKIGPRQTPGRTASLSGWRRDAVPRDFVTRSA